MAVYKSHAIIIPFYPAKLHRHDSEKNERRPERQQAVGIPRRNRDDWVRLMRCRGLSHSW